MENQGGVSRTWAGVAAEGMQKENRNKFRPNFQRTVLLECDRDGGPYFRSDIISGLKDIVQVSAIVALGTLKFNNCWSMTVKAEGDKDNLLNARNVKVKGLSCKITSLNSNEISGKIFWLPYEIDDNEIIEFLGKYGRVVSMKKEYSREKGMEHIATNVRNFRIELKQDVFKEDIPHIMNVFDMDGLIVISNREPICLRCNNKGHIRRYCKARFCRRCRKFEQHNESCELEEGRNEAVDSDIAKSVVNETDIVVHMDNLDIAPVEPEPRGGEGEVGGVSRKLPEIDEGCTTSGKRLGHVNGNEDSDIVKRARRSKIKPLVNVKLAEIKHDMVVLKAKKIKELEVEVNPRDVGTTSVEKVINTKMNWADCPEPDPDEDGFF